MPKGSATRMKPKPTAIVKTVSADSLSSPTVGDTTFRADESVPYLTVYYPPPPPFLTMGGPHAPPPMVIHNGGYAQSAAYFHQPQNHHGAHYHQHSHHRQVPYGYVLVPAYEEAPRVVATNFQGIPSCENQPPVPPHRNLNYYPDPCTSIVEGPNNVAPLVLPPKKRKTQRKKALALTESAMVQLKNVAPAPCSSMNMVAGGSKLQAESKTQGICAATLLLEAARLHEEREEAKKKQVITECDKSCNVPAQVTASIKPEKKVLAKKSPHKAKLKKSKLPLSKCEKVAYRKHHWSSKEDEILRDAVTKMGAKRWASIAELLPGRLGKHCRNRWCQHLAPHVRKGVWDLEEDYEILKGHAKFGNRWSLIARNIPGRTDNAIKNRFFGSMKTKIEYYLLHRRGKLEIDSVGRYDYQNDVEGCLWMVHGIPNEDNFDCYSADHYEYVTAFAEQWKKSKCV